MKAITLCQPYAAWVAVGQKDETRVWKTAYRGPLAIHVSNRVDHEAMVRVGGPYHSAQMLNERGRIIAVCDLRDIRPMTPADEPRAKIGWAARRQLWLLENVRRAGSAYMKGRLGLWEVADDLIKLVPAAQESAAARGSDGLA
jgi:hypothetical protein